MNYKKRDLVEIAFLFYSFEQTTVCKVSDYGILRQYFMRTLQAIIVPFFNDNSTLG